MIVIKAREKRIEDIFVGLTLQQEKLKDLVYKR